MNTRVAIIIINWKTPELLAGCLSSLGADRGASRFEIWVVDNDSRDGSVEMVASHFPEVKLIANPHNVGFAAACNQVIPRVNAPYILLLNPDCLVVADAVSGLCDFLDANADCAAVGPKVLNPDGTLQLACRRSFPSPAAAFYRLTYLSKLFPNNPQFAKYNLTFANENQQLDVDALSGSCMLVRNSVVRQVGLLDEDIFMFGEDIDWCWRFKQIGWRVVYMPQSVIYHYHGASSRLRKVGATINLHKGMEVFYRKHLSGGHSALFNVLVYSAIWLRAALFMILSAVQMLLPGRRVVAMQPTGAYVGKQACDNPLRQPVLTGAGAGGSQSLSGKK